MRLTDLSADAPPLARALRSPSGCSVEGWEVSSGLLQFSTTTSHLPLLLAQGLFRRSSCDPLMPNRVWSARPSVLWHGPRSTPVLLSGDMDRTLGLQRRNLHPQGLDLPNSWALSSSGVLVVCAACAALFSAPTPRRDARSPEHVLEQSVQIMATVGYPPVRSSAAGSTLDWLGPGQRIPDVVIPIDAKSCSGTVCTGPLSTQSNARSRPLIRNRAQHVDRQA